ncbi:hypothetical protein [Cellulomonas cellasea]|uniref:Lipoprotein n=1 Tax=Cellulomonas cellasea TaxID=43670 RepID=A0A7W4UCB7_9CELL|nr:hypothetical protein [Cellulomonas cellasea]MBB2921568.1 hypothetical protein [Cellulomonas cellasea]
MLRPPLARRACTALVPALVAVGALAGCTTAADPAPGPTPGASVAASTPSPTEPLLTAGPDTGSAVGRLVEGFPTDLVTVPADAEVLVSSAQPPDAAGLREISLNLRSAQDAAALLDGVRATVLAAGFAETTGTAAEPGLAAQAAFSRSEGQEIVIVGVLDRDGVRTLTLGGRVRTGS